MHITTSNKRLVNVILSFEHQYQDRGHFKMNFSYERFNISIQENYTTNKLNPFRDYSINIIWLIITAITLTTNLSALLIIVCRHNLRVLSNAVLCSMFICGCLFAVLYLLPGQTIISWRHSSNFLCNIVPLFGVATTTCYNLHLCAICTNKVISIITPFRHRQLLRQRNVIIIISLFWIIPFTTSLIPVISFKPYSAYCPTHSLATSQLSEVIFYTVFFVLVVIIPIIFTTMLYVVAFIIVNRRNRINISNANYTLHQTRQLSSTGPKTKILLQMFAVLGLFVFCWLPYFILFIMISYVYFDDDFLYYRLHYLQYIAFSHPAINPILFAYYTRSIRDEIKQLISQCYRPIRPSASIYQQSNGQPKHSILFINCSAKNQDPAVV